ncbi:hypothetical protein DID76_00980 [Candidatus Marinamargulisbacteria bacterium SCGC AG-414-C22]|nr:hypothetical protein DID76_00980 [Candidatus Marinamargulisbacteria bacterium SCGC AG-414-C22]
MKFLCHLILIIFINMSVIFAYNIDHSNIQSELPNSFFEKVSNLSVGGYFDTEYFSTIDSSYTSSKTDSIDTFKAHRFILGVSSIITDRISLNSEIEFEYGGYVTNTDADSNVQKGEIKIEQAWLDYKLSDTLTNRIGIILVPFGRVNVLHDSNLRDATQRPLYSKYIVPSTWFDTGTGFHGKMSYNDVDFGYEVYVVNGLADTDDLTTDDIKSSNGIRKARPNYKIDNNNNKALAGRVFISPRIGFDVGYSFYQGKYDDDNSKNIALNGMDLFFKKGKHEFIAEYAIASIDSNSGTVPKKMDGGYIEFRSHVLQTYLKSKLFSFKRPIITVFARTGFVNTDHATDYVTYRYTLGFNFRPVESVVYKLEFVQDNYDQPTETGFVNQLVASVAVGF